MQRSGGGGSGGGSQRQQEDWTDAARKAFGRAAAGPVGVKIKCPGNLLLYFFLVELQSCMEGAADPGRHRNALFNIRRTKQSVLGEPCRVASRAHLVGLVGCGDMLSKLVERNLWSLYPPDEEDEEEAQLRAQRDAAKRAADAAEAASKRAAAKQQKAQAAAAAAAGAAAAAAGFGSGGVSHGSSQGGSGGAAAAAAAGGGVDPADAFRQPGVAAHDPLVELARILRRDPKAAALHAEVQRQAAAAPPGAFASGGSSGGGGGSFGVGSGGGGGSSGGGGASAGRTKAAAAGSRKRGAAAAAAAGDSDDGAEDGGSQQQQQPKKRKTAAAPKEYVPAVGSANYAFVITLYLSHRGGRHHLGKEELIAAAEASKLADVPIRGNTNGWAAARGAGKWYDGWSCVKTLENRDVPLIQRWSNPIKIRLTAAGMQLGAKLYKHATDSGKMQRQPGVDPDEPPPPGSPTAAAAADLAGAAAAAAAAKEAAAAAKKQQQEARKQNKTAGGSAGKKKKRQQQQEEEEEEEPSQRYPHSPLQQQRQQRQAAAAGSCGDDDLDGLDAAVAAAIAATHAAAAAAARLGVTVDGRSSDGGAAAAGAAGAGGCWSDDDPWLAAAAAAAAASGWGPDDDGEGPVCISDADDDNDSDGDYTQQQQQQQAKKRPRSKPKPPPQQQHDADADAAAASDAGDDADVAAVMSEIFAGDVQILVDMGFDSTAADKALRAVEGSLLQAITLLTESPELVDSMAEQKQKQKQQQRRQQQQKQTQQTQSQSQPQTQTQQQAGGSQPTQQSAADDRQQQQQRPAAAAAAGRGRPPRPDNLHRTASVAAATAAAAAADGGLSRQGSGVTTNSNASGGSSRGGSAAAAAADGSGYIGLDLESTRAWQVPLLDQALSLPLPLLAPGSRFDSAYQVVLLIDQREQYSRTGAGPGGAHRTLGRTESLRQHAAAIAAQGVTVDSGVTLPCGDVAWVAQHKVTQQRYLLDFLAERKSYCDLSSSIIDGRYTAQKWVMGSAAGGARTCFYILEGNPADLNAQGQVAGSKQAACVTALHRMLLHDGFKVLETGGPAETVDLLASITKILVELYSPLTHASSTSGQAAAVAQSLESWKAGIATTRRTKTVRQKWQELLLTVQGIGEEAVSAIVAAYPTPISLYRAYQATITAAMAAQSSGSNATAAARGLLANLTQGSGQRLGPAKAAVVYDRLFANGWNLSAGGGGQ